MPAIKDILLAATIRTRLANPAPSVPLDDVINKFGFGSSEFEESMGESLGKSLNGLYT